MHACTDVVPTWRRALLDWLLQLLHSSSKMVETPHRRTGAWSLIHSICSNGVSVNIMRSTDERWDDAMKKPLDRARCVELVQSRP